MHVHQLPQVHLPPPLGVLLRAVALAVVVPGPVPVDRHSRAQAVVHAALAGGAAYRQVLGAHVQACHQLRVCSVRLFHRNESGLEEKVVRWAIKTGNVGVQGRGGRGGGGGLVDRKALEAHGQTHLLPSLLRTSPHPSSVGNADKLRCHRVQAQEPVAYYE